MLSAENISFTLGGVYFGDPEYNVVVMGREDPGWPGLNRTTYDIPFREGAEADGGFLKTSSWTVPCRIDSGDEDSCRATLETLCYVMQSQVDIPLIFDSRPQFYFMVSGMESASARWDSGQGAIMVDLNFSLNDPTGYAVDETEKVYTITTNPQTFSVLAGDLEIGSVAPWPTWILNAAADCTAWTITNNTTGEAFNDTTDLANGHYRKLDSKLMEKLHSAGGVNYTRVNSGGSGPVPRLLPRVTNSITVSGLTAGTLTVKYRERIAAAIR